MIPKNFDLEGFDLENSAVSYKCPNCGGELVWNAEKQLFVCGWCSSDFPENEINKAPVNDAEAQKQQEMERQFADDTVVYTCSSCGAEIFCDHSTAATFCYYCHNPVALKGRLSGSYRPEMILPFQMSRDQAVAAFKAHCMKKWFLPSDFLSTSQLEKITGLYVPFWLADCDVDAYAIAEGSEEISHTRHGTTVVTTHVYQLDRAAKMSYMGIPADGSLKIEDTLMDAIEPYDYRLLRNFDMSYLSGFFCDKYDVGKDQVFSRIKTRVEDGAEQVLMDDIRRYSNLVVKSKKARIFNTKWHYMMLPVWFLTYKHRGKIYGFAMNGQTGKFAGIFPVSRIKIAIAAILVGLIAGFIAYQIGGSLI